MFDAQFFQNAIIGFPVIMFSLTVHEFFHAWSAMKFGDTTARDMGRLTLNPIAHMDLMGTIVMVISGFRFGWAKPVPVNPMNLRNPRENDIWISAAGPLSNIGLAIIAAFVLRAINIMNLPMPEALYRILDVAVQINLILAFFNMIPLFPLDGSHILRNIMGPQHEYTFDQLDRVAPFILLLLLFTGALSYIIGPPISFFSSMLLGY